MAGAAGSSLPARQVLALCLVDLARALSLVYEPPVGPPIYICTCAKCGSTSVLTALFVAITGKPPRRDVHTQRTWSSLPAGRAAFSFQDGQLPRRPDTLAFRVVRDPVERYLSSFESAAACCARQQPRTPCIVLRGQSDKLLAYAAASGQLPDSAGNASAPCLHVDEFAATLLRAHSSPGDDRPRLGMHFLPQDRQCTPAPAPGVQLHVGTVRQTLATLAKLSHPAFARPLDARTHEQQHAPRRGRAQELEGVRSTYTVRSIRKLCLASRSEFEALRDVLSPETSTLSERNSSRCI